MMMALLLVGALAAVQSTTDFSEYTGVRITKEQSAVFFGVEEDVALARTGPNTLTIAADVDITGQLTRDGNPITYDSGEDQSQDLLSDELREMIDLLAARVATLES